MRTIIKNTELIKIFRDESYRFRLLDELRMEIMSNPEKYSKIRSRWVISGYDYSGITYIKKLRKAKRQEIEKHRFNTEYIEYLNTIIDNLEEPRKTLLKNMESNTVFDWTRSIINLNIEDENDTDR